MDTYALKPDSCIQDVITAVQSSEGPVAVLEEGSECLIALRPAVFEELLFGSLVLGCAERPTLRF